MPLYALEGKQPTLAPGAWVAPSADLIGDVRLAEDASVWFGAVIRGDNTPIIVGPRSNIQEGAMGHSDAGTPLNIGADCTIGHHAVLHGCTIEDRVLIGMGAIILNRAVIGAGSIVGAGALVTEGKTFPPEQPDRRQPGPRGTPTRRQCRRDVVAVGEALCREGPCVCGGTDTGRVRFAATAPARKFPLPRRRPGPSRETEVIGRRAT